MGRHNRDTPMRNLARDLLDRIVGKQIDGSLLFEFVDDLGIAIVITDGDLAAPGPKILFANSAFTGMTGYSLTEVLGRSPRLLQGSATDRRATRRFASALRSGRSATMRVVNYRKSGEPYLCEVMACELPRSWLVGMHKPLFVAFEREVLLSD
ncbi:MAG TPA: PAS domain-containing protein [Stellaceae bacterium]|jgi:PAS domain S-box-containing protein